METKTALVTGGSGYLGSFLCKRLKREGWNVILYDIKPPLHTYCDTIIIDDILNREMVRTVFRNNKIDVVFHLAGRIEVGLSAKDPTKFWEINVGGTLIVLDAMKNNGCDTIFFSSTAGVYFCGNIPVPEDECTTDNSVYSNTKLACERAIEDSFITGVAHDDAPSTSISAQSTSTTRGAQPATHLRTRICRAHEFKRSSGDFF